MKKHTFSLPILTLLMAFSLLSCSTPKSDKAYTISGTLPADVDAEWIYLYAIGGEKPLAIDSARIQNGAFRLEGEAPDTILLAALHPGSLDEYHALGWSVFIEPGDITVDTNSEFVTGTPLNDGLRSWMDTISMLMSPEELNQFFAVHWSEHSSDIVGALVLAQLSPYLEFSMVDTLAAQIPEAIRSCYLVTPFFNQMESLSKMQPGQLFTDVKVATLDGNPVALSDHIGKGSYVLVDFWASWCGPCRQAMPQLQSVVKKYKKLSVIGIAVSDKVDDTKAAMTNLNITWPVLYDPEALSAKTYGISAIPAMILFGPDGTIVARDFDVNELDDLLSEHLK